MSRLTTFIFASLLLISCEDKINEGFGSLTINFIYDSQTEKNNTSSSFFSIGNANKSSSINSTSFADVDIVRIKIGNDAPVSISVTDGSASYSKSGLSEGSISITVELLGQGEIKYIQNKNISIIANQNVTASFNNFAVINQQLTWEASLDSSYDVGEDITLSWNNTHNDRPVDIERWDFVGNTWIRSSILAANWTGSSGVWSTQSEPQGESVKIRIQSKVSNAFVDSPTFSLIGDSNQNISNVQYTGLTELSTGPTLIISYDVMSITFDGASSDNRNFDISYVSSDGQGSANIVSNYNYFENGPFLWNPGTEVFKAEDGEGWFFSGKTIRVCVASTNVCSSSPDFRASGWSGSNYSQSNIDITKVSDGGTGDKLLFIEGSATNVSVNTSGGTGDVDIYLDEMFNANTPNSSFNTIATSTNSGNSDNINWSGSSSATYFMVILRPFSNVQGVTITSNASRQSEDIFDIFELK